MTAGIYFIDIANSLVCVPCPFELILSYSVLSLISRDVPDSVLLLEHGHLLISDEKLFEVSSYIMAVYFEFAQT